MLCCSLIEGVSAFSTDWTHTTDLYAAQPAGQLGEKETRLVSYGPKTENRNLTYCHESTPTL